MIDFKRATQLIDKFAGRRITVLGDLMLDEFIWGEVRRISPEAPVPIVDVKRETWNLGGAANVVANLLALGARVVPIGIVGVDDAAALLRDSLSSRGAETSRIISDPARPTTRKTRIVAHNQQMIRADRENRAPIAEELEVRIISLVSDALADSEAIIISDYDKGLLTPRLLGAAVAAARARNKIVCLDPKIKNFLHYRNVDYITPNQAEAERVTDIEISDDASLHAAAQRIRKLLDCRNVLITRGEFGMALLNSSGKMMHIPTFARQVYDGTGAGDTVISTLTLALAAGAEPEEAAFIANHAAGVVVSKFGTATLSTSELSMAIRDIDA
ncbi:MAG: D-glycero-beta-D-manno-heptose-7-phosphate kinase [Blastocatellia bacterium]|nr:D-glycero-beta-D-manno-heptose-7-phosphate kinase [Blastocatellia bacterium]